ncbi:MAG: hypothetical protein FWD89_02580 [Firmicutes bacterium]|nr:hypothetical protein [Bacillota bacterium]MCL2771175.1 hypothetical protein [Bacillota bacterium]
MSLSREGLENAFKRGQQLNERINKIFKQLELPLEDMIQMNHYGAWHLFGKVVGERTTDEQIIKIIKKTPEKHWHGHIGAFGGWFVDGEEVLTPYEKARRKKDAEEADKHWKKRFDEALAKAEAGEWFAMYEVGNMYQRGTGCEVNMEEGQKWLDKAEAIKPKGIGGRRVPNTDDLFDF